MQNRAHSVISSMSRRRIPWLWAAARMRTFDITREPRSRGHNQATPCCRRASVWRWSELRARKEPRAHTFARPNEGKERSSAIQTTCEQWKWILFEPCKWSKLSSLFLVFSVYFLLFLLRPSNSHCSRVVVLHRISTAPSPRRDNTIDLFRFADFCQLVFVLLAWNALLLVFVC